MVHLAKLPRLLRLCTWHIRSRIQYYCCRSTWFIYCNILMVTWSSKFTIISISTVNVLSIGAVTLWFCARISLVLAVHNCLLSPSTCCRPHCSSSEFWVFLVKYQMRHSQKELVVFQLTSSPTCLAATTMASLSCQSQAFHAASLINDFNWQANLPLVGHRPKLLGHVPVCPSLCLYASSFQQYIATLQLVDGEWIIQWHGFYHATCYGTEKVPGIL